MFSFGQLPYGEMGGAQVKFSIFQGSTDKGCSCTFRILTASVCVILMIKNWIGMIKWEGETRGIMLVGEGVALVTSEIARLATNLFLRNCYVALLRDFKNVAPGIFVSSNIVMSLFGP